MRVGTWLVATALAAIATGSLAPQAGAASVIDEWANVKAPPAPALKPVTLEPKTTALLVFDMIRQLCNAQRFQLCPGTVPAIKNLLDEARASGVMVVYSVTLTPKAARSDILPALAPTAGEHLVKGNIDKFFHTDLEAVLKANGITTVITTGVAAQGAVINTASDAAQRGFTVILPADGISAQDYYYDQYTVWQLSHAPLLANRTTLTSTDMIKFSSDVK